MIEPQSAGLGLRDEHFAAALAETAQGLWFEVHPENYMAGGDRLDWLLAIAERHPVSLHGVALSLAADCPPDPRHLLRLKSLCDLLSPALVSEHMAWSQWRGSYHPDLLPFPRTADALARIADNIERTQESLGRTIAVENPSHYLRLDGHEFDEIDFLAELARRTGCSILLDVNNVYVSAANLGFDAATYIDRFPGAIVGEIHLAGHSPDEALGSGLLIDGHDAPVCEEVWALFERLVARIGARPTLVERDDDIPPFAELMAERNRAQSILDRRLEQAA